jgi:hypothetical protein
MNLINGKARFFRVFVSVIMLGIIIFFTGRYILYYQIKKTIEQELLSLKDQGIHVTYKNLEVDAWDGQIEVHELAVKVRKDSSANVPLNEGLDAVLPYVLIKGIDLIPFLQSKTLSINVVHSFQTNITYKINSTLFEHDKKLKRKISLQNISVKSVELPKIDFYLTDKQSSDTIAHILSDIQMNDLFLTKQLDSLTWKKGNVTVSNFAMNYNKENYGVSIKKIQVAIDEKSLMLDSLLIKPSISRSEFMKLKGIQTDYLKAAIPYLKIKSIDWYTFPTATLQIDHVQLGLALSMFRDKRYPFAQTEDRALPAHFLQRLSVKLKIDTVTIKDSFISYEEMPESGDSTGLVFFEDLNATITNIHNDQKLKVDSKMHANTRFMGAGYMDVYFTFPYDTLQPYRVAGTVKELQLASLNNILGSAARVKVESGVMNNLIFNFTYTPVKSDGNVELNYKNLKVLSLRENRKNEQSVNVVITVLLNAFIIRKDMDEDVRDDKRRGEIQFLRNTKKSVFNYWWKSIFSGIKSAYNLDKLPVKNAKQDKKSLSLKEAWSKIFKKE